MRKKLISILTRIFINGEHGVEDDLSENRNIVFSSICQLSDNDVDKLYVYALKKVDNPRLEAKYLLECLPDDKTTAFTVKINKYLKKKSTLNDEVFIEFVENRNEDVMCRFKAFYVLFTYHHDQKNNSKCRELVDNYRNVFNCFPLWYYTNSQIRYQEEREKDRPDLREALLSARKCIEMYKNDSRYDSNYSGIYHNFAELVFYASELGDKASFDKYFEEAKECIEEAKNINSKFAKYHYTQGRLLMAKC